jgi:hypothetical protein
MTRTAQFIALASIVSCSASTAYPQSVDRRWKLMPDSTVQGLHYDDLARWATYRTIEEHQIRRCAREVALIALQMHETRQALDHCITGKDALSSEALALRGDLRLCHEARMDAERRVGKPNAQGIVLGALLGALATLLLR